MSAYDTYTMTRILIFSPYALWGIHTIYERTMAEACRIRGAELDYLLCDGLPECDQHWDSKAGGGRPSDICQRCQAMAKIDTAKVAIPTQQIGSFVTQEERDSIYQWVKALNPSEFPGATFNGLPLGQWVQSSIIAYFRKYPPDLENWHVASIYGRFLQSAAIVATALHRYLEQNKVDAALLFNGRQSIVRVALEIFRKNGIRVLTHERAEFRRGHINLKPNAHCMSLDPFIAFWADWAEIPLTQSQLEATHRWITERQTGVNLAWIQFNRSFERDHTLRSRMGVGPDQRLWVLFTSSTDETAGDPGLKGPFDSQHEWIRAVIKWVSAHSGVQLVIKVHPNLGGNIYIGAATHELRFYQELESSLPPNVKIVFPEESINAYTLAEEADAGLTFGSTIGLEMAMLGKPVLLASRALYEDCSKILTVRSKESLAGTLEQCLRAESDPEIQRAAFRLAYRYVFQFEMEFSALKVTGIYDAIPRENDLSELGPGNDATLDRISAHLVHGTPLFDAPSAKDRAISTAEEDAFLRKMTQVRGLELQQRAAQNRAPEEPLERVKISVILCTYNRCESLAGALKSVSASKLPPSVDWEVLIVDNNSTDQTRKVAEEFCAAYPGRFQYFCETRQGKSFALDRGTREASGDIIAFMGDDVTVEPDWLHKLTKPLVTAGYLGTGGRICAPADVVIPTWMQLEGPSSLAQVLATYDRGREPLELREDTPFGTNMAFRREAFETFDTFRMDLNPTLDNEIRGEDTEFCLRLLKAGLPIFYVPDAVVYHDVPLKWLRKDHFLRWYFDYGRAVIRKRAHGTDMWFIPRPLFGIAKHSALMLPRKIFRWLFTFEEKERFVAKTQVWMTIGETTELFKQLGQKGVSQVMKPEPLGQEESRES